MDRAPSARAERLRGCGCEAATGACALATSTATVSRGVSRLEDRLGARLFDRTSRQLALTEFGRSLAESAAAILREAQEAEGAARELSSQPRGEIRLAVPMSFGLRWVAPLLPEFLARYPDVSVHLHLSDDKVDLVGEAFDAALRIAVMPDSSLVARRICPVAPLIVASPAYLLARGGAPQGAWRPGGERLPAVRLPRSKRCLALRGPRRQRAGGQARGKTPGHPCGRPDPDPLAGLAVAELPDFIATEYLVDCRLRAILEEWTLPKDELYFVTPSGRARAAKVGALKDFMQARLSQSGWRLPPADGL